MNDQLSPEAISFSAQFGGVDASTILKPHFFALKKEFHVAQDLPCDAIREMAFILRADGAIQQFHFEGCENVELNRKKKYISIDVGVPIKRWQGRSDAEIAAYLIDSMWEGLEEMLARLAANKITCDAAAIRVLFEAGAQRYLATWATPNE